MHFWCSKSKMKMLGCQYLCKVGSPFSHTITNRFAQPDRLNKLNRFKTRSGLNFSLKNQTRMHFWCPKNKNVELSNYMLSSYLIYLSHNQIRASLQTAYKNIVPKILPLWIGIKRMTVSVRKNTKWAALLNGQH